MNDLDYINRNLRQLGKFDTKLFLDIRDRHKILTRLGKPIPELDKDTLKAIRQELEANDQEQSESQYDSKYESGEELQPVDKTLETIETLLAMPLHSTTKKAIEGLQQFYASHGCLTERQTLLLQTIAEEWLANTEPTTPLQTLNWLAMRLNNQADQETLSGVRILRMQLQNGLQLEPYQYQLIQSWYCIYKRNKSAIT